MSAQSSLAAATALLGGGSTSGTLGQQVEEWAALSGIPYEQGADAIRDTLFGLKNLLQALPASTIRDGKTPMAGLPLLQRGQSEASIAFAAPQKVDVVGGFMLQTMSRASPNIDVVMTVPAGTVSDSDRKNFLVHDKLRLYLRGVAKGLRGDPAIASVQVGSVGADQTALHLVVTPAAWQGEGQPSWLRATNIHLHAVPPPDTFQTHLLRPKWNNVVRWVYVRGAPQPSTPRYNSQLLSWCHYALHLRALHSTLSAVPVARSVVVLLKAWLRARGMAGRVDGWTPTAVTALVAALVQTGEVREGMTTHQGVRAVLLWLAHNDVTACPLQVLGDWTPASAAPASDEEEDGGYETGDSEDVESGSDSGSDSDSEGEEEASAPAASGAGGVVWTIPADEAAPSLADLAAQSPVVIADPTGWANFAAGVSRSAAVELRRQAALSLPAFGLATDPAARTALVDDPDALTALARGSTDRMTGAIAAPATTVARAPAGASLAALQGGMRSGEGEAFDRIVPLPLPPCPVSVPITATAGGSRGRKASKGTPKADKAAWSAAVAGLEADGVTLQDGNALVAGPWWMGLLLRAQQVLTAGLGDRVHTLAVLPQWQDVGQGTATPLTTLGRKRAFSLLAPAPSAWALDAAPPAPTALVAVMTVRPRCAARNVDRGPSDAVDAPGAVAFNALWGSKAETRRFADGSIVPAVVWDLPPARRSETVDAITRHLATTHGICTASAEHPAPSAALDRLSQPEWAGGAAPPPGSPTSWAASVEAAAASIATTADVLQRALQRAPGMPLKVFSLDVTGAAARSTAFPPACPNPVAADTKGTAAPVAVAAAAPRHAAAVDAVVTLETSGKWPADLSAIAASKCAFLLKMKYGLPKVLGSTVHAHLRVPAALRAVFSDVPAEAAALVGETPDSIAAALKTAAADGEGSLPGLLDHDLSTWAPCLLVMLNGYVFRLWLGLPQELAAWTALARTPVTQVLGSTTLVAPLGGIFAAEAAVASGFVNVGRVSGGSGEGGKVLPPRPTEDLDHLSPSARAFVTPSSTAASARAVALFKAIVLAPRHAKAVAAFASIFPAFAGGVRLACRWLAASGLLHAHVSQQAVELTMAGVLMDPRPFGVPASASAAFLRWMRWVSTWDFASAPLLVDWEGTALPSDAGALMSRHTALARSGQPAPAWHVCTPWDRGLWRPAWTGTGLRGAAGPTPIVAARIRALATTALHSVTGAHRLSTMGSPPPTPTPGSKRSRGGGAAQAAPAVGPEVDLEEVLFQPPRPADFDVVVRLHPKFAVDADGVGGEGLTGAVFKNTMSAARRGLLLDWSPAQALVRAVQGSPLDKFAFVFPAPDGCSVLLAWKPDAFPTAPATAWRKAGKGAAQPKHDKALGTVQQALALLWGLGQGAIKSVTLSTA